MKPNERLYELLNKYLDHISCERYVITMNEREMYVVDIHNVKKKGVSCIIELMIQDNHLNECFTDSEFRDLKTLTPPRFRKEFEKYVE